MNDADLRTRLQACIDQKPSLWVRSGQLEALMLRLGMILGSTQPQLQAPQMLVCATDHGLAARGVSAYPTT